MPNHLNNYLEKWKLSDPQPLAETATSFVYTVTFEGTRVVLKLLKPVGVKDEQNGAISLRYWQGQGAVRLLRDDEQTHLLEYADGEDLAAMVKRGEDEQATRIIASVLQQLHTPRSEPFPDGLTPLKTRFRSLFAKAEADRQHGSDSLYVRAAPVAQHLLDYPREVSVLHGDIHHENIRMSPRGWLAFDPKGLVGEKTYDAANTLCNPLNMPELTENEARLLRNADILAQSMGVELSRMLAFTYAYACLSASWSLEDGDDPTDALNIAALIEPHL
jgi:streptomycin 6-kinase